MSVTTKLVGFLVVLLASFAAAVGVGKAVGPVAPPAAADHAGMAGMGSGMEKPGADAASVPKGLMVSQDGYTFRLDRTSSSPGAAVPVSFTILGPDGRAVTDYDLEHEKKLHLIAVRRDFAGFQHVHPEMAADGTWKTTLDLTSGQWRLFADFKATGAKAALTLGNDLAVSGSYAPAAPAADSRTATVDGYTVKLDGDLAAGAEAKLTLTVTRDGAPVTVLEPYLGAYGHLVTLRSGDLAYLHVHPEGAPGDGVTQPGPGVVFYTEVPSPGRYHLYLNFKHEGVVRTAAFTVTVTGSAAPSSPKSQDDESGAGHSGGGH
jgi:hypothetical protein